MLRELISDAVRLIPGTQEGSLSVVTGRRRVDSQQPSGELPQLIDAIQTETGQGPSLDAVHENQTVRVPDLRVEQRWPEFARRALEADAGSMLSFQLYVHDDNLGALNLFSRQPDAFDDESEKIGLLFASHAAVAFAGARKVDGLTRAVDSRDLIGQAKGILMERYGIAADQAFTVLVRASQHSHTKLHDVAEELTSTARSPPSRGPTRVPEPTACPGSWSRRSVVPGRAGATDGRPTAPSPQGTVQGTVFSA